MRRCVRDVTQISIMHGLGRRKGLGGGEMKDWGGGKWRTGEEGVKKGGLTCLLNS